MSFAIGIYDALKSVPGMDDNAARRAAEELGSNEARATGIESRLDRISDRLDRIDKTLDRIDGRLTSVEAKASTLQWMFGVLVAGIAAVAIKLFV